MVCDTSCLKLNNIGLSNQVITTVFFVTSGQPFFHSAVQFFHYKMEQCEFNGKCKKKLEIYNFFIYLDKY